MENESVTVYSEITYGSDEYHRTVALRDEILRKPLGLAFSTGELAAEKDSFHLVCYQDGNLAACVVLKPVSSGKIHMRQLAVGTSFQGRGIGTALVVWAESFVLRHGYHEIIMHARESASGFYGKLGYVRQGDSFIEVTIPHVLMRKVLANINKK